MEWWLTAASYDRKRDSPGRRRGKRYEVVKRAPSEKDNSPEVRFFKLAGLEGHDIYLLE